MTTKSMSTVLSTTNMTDSAGFNYTVTNTTQFSSSSPEDYSDGLTDLERAQLVTIYARFYMLGFIIPIGLFFNSFAFFVFLRSPNIRKTTTGRFLIALTIADTIYLTGK